MSSLTIAAIQFDIQWLNKKANLEYLDQLLYGSHQVDLILLPETFSTGFAIDIENAGEPEQGGMILNWMRTKAELLESVIAGSVLVNQKNKSNNKTRKVNRFYWVYPNGKVEYYDKRHLFRLGNEQDHVLAGTERKILTIKDIRILPSVCYDLRFPVWSRNRNDYDLMINVANWPAVRRNVWDTLLKARAMENQAYVVGVNRVGKDGKGIMHSGGTAVYDFNGEVISATQDNQQEMIITKIDLNKLAEFKCKFPFFLDGDEFSLDAI